MSIVILIFYIGLNEYEIIKILSDDKVIIEELKQKLIRGLEIKDHHGNSVVAF